jgi:CubicO group peptidase (beta-lactamase class C family)
MFSRRYFHFFYLGILLFVFCYGLSAQVTKSLNIDSILDQHFTTNDPYNGVILIAEKGKTIFQQAYGYRDIETGVKLKVDDVFELASVSKQFTAMIVMMLQQDGKLNYDDPVAQYLSIPYKAITIRHLLNHTSGLPDYQEIMDKYWDKSKAAGNNDILEYLNKYAPPALFVPGAKYEYSNTGYVLLASIAEKASGEDFSMMLRKRIFSKLNMTYTDIRTVSEKKKLSNLAYGHMLVKGANEYKKADSFPSSNYTIWLGNREGPGRISSTAQDLLKWDRALYNRSFLTPAMISEAFKPALLNDGKLSQYGFGWDLVNDQRLGKVVEHNGDNPGYKTQIVRYVDADKTIILLCNNAHANFPTLLAALKDYISSKGN